MDEPVYLGVELGGVLGRAGDDERRARLVDQDRVDLVDDGVGKRPLDHVVEPELHVVAQVVEAELVVGPVGHIGGIGDSTLLIRESVDDAAHGEPQELVDLAHPLGVPAGEIIVDRDHVAAFAGQRVQIHRQGRYQGLALAGLHFGDRAPVEDNAAHELDVEMALVQSALGRLAHRREGFDQKLVQRLAAGQPLLQPRRASPQLFVGERLDRRLERIDRLNVALEALQITLVGGAEKPLGGSV